MEEFDAKRHHLRVASRSRLRISTHRHRSISSPSPAKSNSTARSQKRNSLRSRSSSSADPATDLSLSMGSLFGPFGELSPKSELQLKLVCSIENLEIVVRMAGWCRKCIYLKPKLEKLAADYYPSIRFFCIDVNTVPQRLVNRAGVTMHRSFPLNSQFVVPCHDLNASNFKQEQKMPTIQLWKDCKKQAEVIGGHKAWLVVDDVREMIENVLI